MAVCESPQRFGPLYLRIDDSWHLHQVVAAGISIGLAYTERDPDTSGESNSHPHDADMDPVYAEETELDWPQGRLSFAESLSRSSRLQWRKRRGQCWWKRCIPLVLLTGLRLAVEPICQPKYAEIDPPKLAYGGRADHVNVVGGAS